MKLLSALLCAGVGLYLMYWVGQRRFARRNQYRAEEFSSYRNKVTSEATEKFLWNAGIGMVVLGALLSL